MTEVMQYGVQGQYKDKNHEAGDLKLTIRESDGKWKNGKIMAHRNFISVETNF